MADARVRLVGQRCAAAAAAAAHSKQADRLPTHLAGALSGQQAMCDAPGHKLFLCCAVPPPSAGCWAPLTGVAGALLAACLQWGLA
jgi:hypothetical protein